MRWAQWLCAGCLLVLAGVGWAQPHFSPSVPADSMAARMLACTACHGQEGRSTPDGYYPRIAGKPAGYLYHQLLNFRQGRRSYPQMAYLLRHLDDAYLQQIAAYFAALDVPYAAPLPPRAQAVVLARGRLLVEQGDAGRQLPACVQCHGQALTGSGAFIPGLLGLSQDYLVSQLGAWQTGQRHALAPDCMAQVAQTLTAAEVGAIAAWLAAQPVPVGNSAAALFAQPLPLRCGAVSDREQP